MEKHEVKEVVEETIEEVLEMIHQINDGKKAIDSDRWRLLRKELR